MAMNTTILCMIALLLIALPRPPTAVGQQHRFPMPRTLAKSPRERRAIRDKAVERAGPESRNFVEAYGEDAVAAIYACTSLGIQKLIEFHASGGMGNLPRPRDLLRAVAQYRHGDDVILWAAANQTELVDPERFDAFINEPLEFALGLKTLAEGVEELRAARRTPQPSQRPMIELAKPPARNPTNPRDIAVIVGVTAVVGLAIWWRRKRRQF
jgi:hypothetical protein